MSKDLAAYQLFNIQFQVAMNLNDLFRRNINAWLWLTTRVGKLVHIKEVLGSRNGFHYIFVRLNEWLILKRQSLPSLRYDVNLVEALWMHAFNSATCGSNPTTDFPIETWCRVLATSARFFLWVAEIVDSITSNASGALQLIVNTVPQNKTSRYAYTIAGLMYR